MEVCYRADICLQSCIGLDETSITVETTCEPVEAENVEDLQHGLLAFLNNRSNLTHWVPDERETGVIHTNWLAATANSLNYFRYSARVRRVVEISLVIDAIHVR